MPRTLLFVSTSTPLLKRHRERFVTPKRRGETDLLEGWPIRVAVHLEEAPAFHFLTRRSSPLPAITWAQRERHWVVRGDSQVGIGGAFTQKLWLALLSIYEAERKRTGEVGVVYYSKSLLAERMRVTRDGSSFEAMTIGLIQLDALRAYVTGKPLPGPDADETRPGARSAAGGPRIEYLYSFLGGEGLDVEEEARANQLYLFPPDGRRRPRTWSRRRLGRYVVACLESQHARTVPDFVFDLKSGWAVRLVRLLGKRAYQDERLEISLGALLPAIPALTVGGTPLRPAKAIERLESAHEMLYRHGFIRDVTISDGTVSYRFGVAHARRRTTLPEGYAAETLDVLVEVFGEERRRPWLADVVQEIGAERARAALSDARRLAGAGSETFLPRLHGLLSATQAQVRADRAAARTGGQATGRESVS